MGEEERLGGRRTSEPATFHLQPLPLLTLASDRTVSVNSCSPAAPGGPSPPVASTAATSGSSPEKRHTCVTASVSGCWVTMQEGVTERRRR